MKVSLKNHINPTRAIAAPVLTAGLLACTLSGTASAQSLTEDIASMISGGTTKIDLRYRYENVEQDNALDDADASTLRTRISFQSATVNKFALALQVDNIMTIGPDDYDSLVLDKYRGNTSVIADPVGTEINIAALSYAIDEGKSLTIGRQRVNHADQRFLGSVGWRQNEQTLDALSYSYKEGSTSIDYSYIWNVNRIFKGTKTSIQPTDFDSNSHALLVSNTQDWGSISGFVYAFDFENGAGASSITYGLKYSGTVGSVNLNASIATQSDHGDNPTSYDANYYSFDAGTKLGSISLKAGIEVLGSDDGVAAFATPMATLHKWQGFADLYLGTPANGIEDLYLTASTAISGVSLAATYHDFSADEGSADYGDELDLVIGYTINPNVNIQAKFAFYDADTVAVDTDKFWLSLNMSF
ncbi:MAG: hypothetical protein R3332_02525 [Pseudohongiellaceae bacterium]|nr:hypothetical protein [Pseudohongiellaceae bacterium]